MSRRNHAKHLRPISFNGSAMAILTRHADAIEAEKRSAFLQTAIALITQGKRHYTPQSVEAACITAAKRYAPQEASNG